MFGNSLRGRGQTCYLSVYSGYSFYYELFSSHLVTSLRCTFGTEILNKNLTVKNKSRTDV